ncbi:MAG: hypothetical protein HPY85_06795 [Anaerolineae bacterium]|nr:hypothetical protein [Anaerolineae bacterium]
MNVLTMLFESPVILILTLVGLVEAAKVLWIERKKFTKQELQIFAVSAFLGLVLGVVVQIYVSSIPNSFNGWVDLVLFGLFLGVIAPWIYKAAGNILEKAAGKFIVMASGEIGEAVKKPDEE